MADAGSEMGRRRPDASVRRDRIVIGGSAGSLDTRQCNRICKSVSAGVKMVCRHLYRHSREARNPAVVKTSGSRLFASLRPG